jgi:hypothetical protein
MSTSSKNSNTPTASPTTPGRTLSQHNGLNLSSTNRNYTQLNSSLPQFGTIFQTPKPIGHGLGYGDSHTSVQSPQPDKDIRRELDNEFDEVQHHEPVISESERLKKILLERRSKLQVGNEEVWKTMLMGVKDELITQVASAMASQVIPSLVLLKYTRTNLVDVLMTAGKIKQKEVASQVADIILTNAELLKDVIAPPPPTAPVQTITVQQTPLVVTGPTLVSAHDKTIVMVMKDKFRPTVRVGHIYDDFLKFNDYCSVKSVADNVKVPLLAQLMKQCDAGKKITEFYKNNLQELENRSWTDIMIALIRVVTSKSPTDFINDLESLTLTDSDTAFRFDDKFVLMATIVNEDMITKIEGHSLSALEQAGHINLIEKFTSKMPMPIQFVIQQIVNNMAISSELGTFTLLGLIAKLRTVLDIKSNTRYRSITKYPGGLDILPRIEQTQRNHPPRNQHQRDRRDTRHQPKQLFNAKPKGIEKPHKIGDHYVKTEQQNQDNKPKVPRCFRCKQEGHMQPDCTKPESSTVGDWMYAPEHIKKRHTTKQNKKSGPYMQANIRLDLSKYLNTDVSNKLRAIIKELIQVQLDEQIKQVTHSLKENEPTVVPEIGATIASVVLNNNCVLKQGGKGDLVPKIRPLRIVDSLLHNTPVRALIDSGSQCSVVSASCLERIKNSCNLTVEEQKNTIELEFADGRKETCDTAALIVNHDGTSRRYVFAVMKDVSSLYDCIFGLDIIIDYQIVIPFISSEVIRTLTGKHKVKPVDQIIDEESKRALSGIIFHHHSEQFMTQIDDCIVRNEATQGTHSTIGEIEINFVDENNRKLGSWSRQMKIPAAAEEEVRKTIQKWKDEGIIEEFIDLKCRQTPDDQLTGPFNTNGFLTFSGKWRFVHNFKPINGLIVDDTNDIPAIDYVFERVASSGAVIFSRIDLRSAYLQIPLRRSDRNVTAFTVWNKRYRFVTAPLGLKHIPSSFQRMIKALLQEKGCADYACNFIDDIIIYSKSSEDHVSHIRTVLDALTGVNLTIQRTKCHFFCEQVPLLGYWLSKSGIQPNMDKLCNMMQWKRPSTYREVQKFCGIIGFFRRFIPHATELLLPIRSIPHKKFDWNSDPAWEEAYQRVFNELVQKVPFLQFPIKDIPIEMATDASNTAIGAEIFQMVNGEKRHLGFHSRTLSDCERRYSIPKKELLSIISHCNHYRELLVGRLFKLHTDAKSLEQLMKALEKQTAKDSTLLGWMSQLAEYDFEVHHIAGKDNHLPDLTSRVQAITAATVDTDSETAVLEFADQTITLENKVSELEKSNTISEDVDQHKRVQALLEEYHSIGHFGANAMYNQLRLMLSNPPKDLKQRCLKFVHECHVCQSIDKKRISFALQQQPQLCLPMQHIHMDLMEVPESNLGYKFIITILDKFSGYVWLKPMLTKTMKEVYANVLEVFLMFGFPQSIKTDNGSEFVNSMITKICEVCKTKHNRIIADNHTGNGRVERQHGTIRDVLKKKLLEEIVSSIHNVAIEGSAWHELVPAIAFAMNTRIHTTTLVAPFSLMFGRAALYNTNIGSNDVETAESDDSYAVMDRYWKLFANTVPQAILERQIQRFQHSKPKYRNQMLKVGDLVMMKNPKHTKNSVKLEGPFRVERSDPVNGHFVLVSMAEPLGFVAPANWLTKLPHNCTRPLTSIVHGTTVEDECFPSEVGKDDMSDTDYHDTAVQPKDDMMIHVGGKANKKKRTITFVQTSERDSSATTELRESKRRRTTPKYLDAFVVPNMLKQSRKK